MARNFSSSGLNCYVEFPKESHKNSISNPSPFPGGDAESRGNGKAVVVVLIGWAGAQDKHLTKYSDIYVHQGYITIRCSVPIQVSISEHSRLPDLASRVITIMTDQGLENHPIFIHTFSNGGAFFYTYLIKEFSKQQSSTAFDFRGTIFDSAPFPQSIQLGYRATKAAFGSDSILGPLVAYMALMYLAICTFVYYISMAWEFCTQGARFVGSPCREKYLLVSSDWLNRICGLRNHAFLFLYSETDAVSPSDKIEMVANYLRRRENHVSLVKFEGSEHVLHYCKYPQEYLSAIIAFIHNALASSAKPPTYWDECH